MSPSLLPLLLVPSAYSVEPRFSYEEAYDNVDGGDWYRHEDNEAALLAWGESYVMRSLVSMYRATGDRTYLDRLVWHADGVLANRDDARSVTDYRGVSAACWRNTTYQPSGESYCYVAHSGMIAQPMVEFALLVDRDGLDNELAWDGDTFRTKADGYVVAGVETVAAHEDQWDPAGFYVFRGDATFLGYPGSDLPLNMSNAMGRLLLDLHDATADPSFLDKATALATRFADNLTLSGDAYVWNYWGGPYVAYGEDISHAAINVDFAVRAADRGVVFDATDIARFTETFAAHVAVDDQTTSDWVGGGSANDPSYKPQVGRWLALDRADVYAHVRDMFDAEHPAASVGSASLLLGWAHLAEFEPTHCAPFFYSADWADTGDWREATAYGANVLTISPKTV